jgi:type VI secretion system protein VasJ
VGSDPICDDEFLWIRDEVTKLSGINDSLIIDTAERLIKTRAKDVRLAVYYLYARTRRDGAQGVAEGFELLSALIERFGPALLPQRAKTRKASLEWLAAQTFLDCLDRVGDLDQAALERSLSALALIIESTADWPEPSRPCLDPLSRRFGTYFEDPQRMQAAAAAAVASGEVQPASALDRPFQDNNGSGAAAKAPSAATASSAPCAKSPPEFGATSEVSSTRELLEQARRMTHFLRDQPDGYLSACRLIRCVRWDTVNTVPPHDVSGKTRLLPPRAELRAQLTRLLLQKQWHALLMEVEAAFMEGANHFWLDLQRFAFLAQEQAGGEFAWMRDLLATDCAQMLMRLHGVEHLAFSDGSAFADDATLDWIGTHATVRDLERNAIAEPVAAVCAQMDWDDAETQAIILASEQGLDVALASLQDKVTHDNGRDRFILHRIMARVAEQADRADMAVHLLTRLDELINQHQLTTWEPALAFDTKHHLLRLLRSIEQLRPRWRGQERRQAHGKERRKEEGRENDANEAGLLQRIETLSAALTTIDAARAVTAM